MERYITFIRNTKTGEEFISARRDEAGRHANVLEAERRKHPHPTYTVHTAYTERELADILETLNRWSGTPAADIAQPSPSASFRQAR